MFQRPKINHWLGLLFFGWAVAMVRALGKVLPFLLAHRETLQGTGATVVVGLMTALFILMGILCVLVTLTAFGLFGARAWARRWAFALVTLGPFSAIADAFIFSVPPSPMKILDTGISLLLLWVLWRSKAVQRIFGTDASLPKIGRSVTMATCVLVVASLATAQAMQLNHRAPAVEHHVTYSEHPNLAPGFVSRELFRFRLVLPADSQIWGADKTPAPLGPLVVAGSPDFSHFMFVAPDTIYDLFPGRFIQVIGFSTVFDFHRHVLLSRWSPVFVGIRRATSSQRMRTVAIKSPEWSGFEEQRRSLSKARTSLAYSLYQRAAPHRSATCTWVFPETDAQYVTQVQRAIGAFEFLSAGKPPHQYYLDAHENLARGQVLDAQFALAQAYLLGPPDVGVTRQLAQVSAQLGSWSFVKKLTEELLKDNPESLADKELFDKALKAIEASKRN